MKVLLISPLPPPIGGMATWTVLYKKSKESKKHDIDILNSAIVGKRTNNISKMFLHEELQRIYLMFSKLNLLLRNNSYDIVHLNISGSKFGMIRDYLMALKIKKRSVNIVSHFHCDTKYMINNRISLFLFKELCNMSNSIFVLNNSSSEHVKIEAGKNSIIVSNFFDYDKKNLNISRRNISESINKIIYVGHIIKRKGCFEIISVAKNFPKLSFNLIGFIGDEVRNITLPPNVNLLGELPREQVFLQMLNSDLFLFPTHTEGFPNVILEAMACGLPIISTPVGAIPDILEDKGGVIVKVNGVDEIIEAIRKLDDKKVREVMSIWNLNRLKTNYTTEIVVKKIFAEYARIKELFE